MKAKEKVAVAKAKEKPAARSTRSTKSKSDERFMIIVYVVCII